MQNVTSGWLVAAKWVLAVVVSLWASVPAAAQTLILLMVMDYATGLLSAAADHRLSSAVGWRGLAKKTATLLLVVAAHFLVRSLHLPFDFCSTLSVGFVVNEAISIVENAADLGVPIPPALLDLLVRSKKLTGRGTPAATVREDLETAAK